MNTPHTNTDCRLCIDMMMPAGWHPVFGPVYRICPACAVTCGECDGRGVYPGNRQYFTDLVDALDHLGFDTDLCPRCCGVIGVYPRIHWA